MDHIEPTTECESDRENYEENARRIDQLKGPEAVVSFYDKYAPSFDQTMSNTGGGASCAEVVNEYLGDKKDAAILDIGAGTGYAALEIRKYGFTNIDGLDASEIMLKKAQEKQAYNKVYQCYMTDNVPCLTTDSYDCVVSVAAIGGKQNHIHHSALQEMIRCTKLGGYVLVVTRKSALAEDSPEGLEMQRLEDLGLWRRLEKRDIHYVHNRPGGLALFQVTKT